MSVPALDRRRPVPADLPPDIAGQIHPDRRANERAYWAARDGLLAEYAGLWVGYADGHVVASGRSPVAVLAAAEATGLRPHLACVSREDEPDRVRRAAFASDTGYPGEPLPVVTRLACKAMPFTVRSWL